MRIEALDYGLAMSAPPRADTRIIGVIHWNQFGAGPSEAKKPTDSDPRLGDIFAQHAAMAVENIQLRLSLHRPRAQARKTAPVARNKHHPSKSSASS